MALRASALAGRWLVCGPGLASLATIGLIFVAPALRERPVLIVAGLCCVTLLWLPGAVRSLPLARRSRRSRTKSPAGRAWRARADIWFVAGAALIALAFVWAPVYFSDDALRHIHDGYYLLRGVDVYSVAPNALPLVLSRLPNHPHLGTLYFPATQWQAVAGALLHRELGFPIVYNTICLGLVLGAWFLARRRDRPVLLHLYGAPVFLIATASRHADAQGLLLIVCIVAILRRRQAATVWQVLIVGVLAAGLPGLKPEGMVWLSAFGGYALWGARWSPAHRALFLGASLGMLGAQAAFACYVLFPTADSFAAFLETARLFTGWFSAYNPVLDLREALYPGVIRPNLLMAMRYELLAAVLLWFCLPLRHGALRGKPAVGGTTRWLVERAAFGGLIFLIFSKGAWHPWYFLWLVPALWLRGFRTAAVVLPGCLPVMYIPVAYLRADGEWWMPGYYLAVALGAVGYLIFRVCAGFRRPVGGNF